MFERPASGERAILVQLDFSEGDFAERLSELRLLVGSAGALPLAVVSGKRSRPAERKAPKREQPVLARPLPRPPRLPPTQSSASRPLAAWPAGGNAGLLRCEAAAPPRGLQSKNFADNRHPLDDEEHRDTYRVNKRA